MLDLLLSHFIVKKMIKSGYNMRVKLLVPINSRIPSKSTSHQETSSIKTFDQFKKP